MKVICIFITLLISTAAFCQKSINPDEINKLIGKPYKRIPVTGRGEYKTEAEFDKSVKDLKFTSFKSMHKFGKFDVVVTYRLNKKDKIYYYAEILAFYPKRASKSYKKNMKEKGYVSGPGFEGENRKLPKSAKDKFRKLFTKDLKNPKKVQKSNTFDQYRYEDGEFTYQISEYEMLFKIEYREKDNFS